jgi:glycyl-tRNA synthetase alpha subunit
MVVMAPWTIPLVNPPRRPAKRRFGMLPLRTQNRPVQDRRFNPKMENTWKMAIF